VQQLRYLPSTPYDKLETVTIEGEAGTQFSSALQDARQAAAHKGGNAMILVEDKEFRRRINGQQRIVRRAIYWVVHLQMTIFQRSIRICNRFCFSNIPAL
jgi:hypothetical protein